jgi:hypothetical protein
MAEEHTKNIRPSTREKHQKGQRRKQRDRKGGEKGDKRRPYKKR